MLPRTLEPEVMDTAEEAVDYDAMDHGEVNRRFVGDFLRARAAAGHADLGRCGQATQRSAVRSSRLTDCA